MEHQQHNGKLKTLLGCLAAPSQAGEIHYAGAMATQEGFITTQKKRLV